MKRALILMAGVLVTSAAHADFWSGLWHTPDQRGEQLMRQGDAAAAAQTYSDPRHKAYAELQAGDYDTAAKGFSSFDDSDAHYNRGNALVHAGQLQDALKAYDTALARNPDNRDAQHNRDLVEQALKQQQSKQQQSSGQQQKDRQKDQQKQDQQQQQGNGQSQSGKDGEQKEAQKDQQGQPQSQQNQQADARNSNGKQDQQNPSAQQPQGQAGQGEQKEQDKAKEAEQARRDAADSLAQQPQKQPAGQAAQEQKAGDGAHGEQKDNPVAVKPATEQQLAQEQWLRRIPDDPGGLLRRKFMIEHMMRQKGQQNENQQRDEQGRQP
ncbi:MAG: tetratricopeptide repeat protein [Nevskia sp.]|nr:tetratricopeptide repeat protein [Nevskia sp.]